MIYIFQLALEKKLPVPPLLLHCGNKWQSFSVLVSGELVVLVQLLKVASCKEEGLSIDFDTGGRPIRDV